MPEIPEMPEMPENSPIFPVGDSKAVSYMAGDGGVPEAKMVVTRDWENEPGVTDEMRILASKMRMEIDPATNQDRYTESQIRDAILGRGFDTAEVSQEKDKKDTTNNTDNRVWVEREGKWTKVEISDVRNGEIPTTFIEGEEPSEGDDVLGVEVEVDNNEGDKRKENTLSKDGFIEAVKLMMYSNKENEDKPHDNESVKAEKKRRRDGKDPAIALLRRNGVDVDYLMGTTGIEPSDPDPIKTRNKRRNNVKSVNSGIGRGALDYTDQADDILVKMNINDEKLNEWGVIVFTKNENVANTRQDENDADNAGNENQDKRKEKKDGKPIVTLSTLDKYLQFAKSTELDNKSIYRELNKFLGDLTKEYINESTTPDRRKKIEALTLVIRKLINDYSEETRVGVLNIDDPDFPKDGDRASLVKWLRDRLKNAIDPISDFSSNRENFGSVFSVIEVDPKSGNRRRIDGSDYVPVDLKKEMLENNNGEKRVLEGLVYVFDKWKSYHKDLKRMTSRAFEDESDYGYPSSEVNNLLLHGLKDENGSEGEGSKRISHAIQIYWAMANPEDPMSSGVLTNAGLSADLNLFSKKYSSDEVKRIREQISSVVGGGYYENIALMYVNFLGLAAKGSTGKESSIPDVMSSMYNIDKLENIPETLRKAMTVYGSGGQRKVSFMPSLRELQIKNGNEKNFYVVIGSNGSFLLKEKLEGGDVDSGWSIDDIIKTGNLHQIDWSNSTVNLFDKIKAKEKQAVKMNAVFDLTNGGDSPSETIRSVDYVGSKSISKKMSAITDSLSHYDIRTRQRVYFLWLWRQLENNQKWKDPKEQENVHLIVKMMRDKGKFWSRKEPYLTDEDYRELVVRFNLGKQASSAYTESGSKAWLLLPNNWKYRKSGIPPKVDY